MLNSIIIAKKEYPLLNSILNILLNYWEKEITFKHYFLFQILFNEMITMREFKQYNCQKASDLIPHFMQLELYKPYTPKLWKNLPGKALSIN